MGKLSEIFDLLAVITFGRTIFDVDDDFPVILLGINLGASLIPVPYGSIYRGYIKSNTEIGQFP